MGRWMKNFTTHCQKYGEQKWCEVPHSSSALSGLSFPGTSGILSLLTGLALWNEQMNVWQAKPEGKSASFSLSQLSLPPSLTWFQLFDATDRSIALDSLRNTCQLTWPGSRLKSSVPAVLSLLLVSGSAGLWEVPWREGPGAVTLSPFSPLP